MFSSPLSTDTCDVLPVCPVNTISEYCTALMAQLAQSLNNVEEHSSDVKAQLCIFHKALQTSLRCIFPSNFCTFSLIATAVLPPVERLSEGAAKTIALNSWWVLWSTGFLFQSLTDSCKHVWACGVFDTHAHTFNQSGTVVKDSQLVLSAFAHYSLMISSSVVFNIIAP